MARNPGPETTAPPPSLGSDRAFDLASFVRAQEGPICELWLAGSSEPSSVGAEASAVLGALVDALEPNGGWWLDVTAESLVEAGVKSQELRVQLARLRGVISDLIAASGGPELAREAATRLDRAATDLVAACERQAQ
ncbi:MAG TPA: hypothetical protein VFA11_11100 [Acidimicrobiales bacterium]|nr:hypothetical protein [Acidimicrobiales bacterium]